MKATCWILVPSVLALWLAGCGGEEAQSVAAAPPAEVEPAVGESAPQAPPSANGEVILALALQRESGVVVDRVGLRSMPEVIRVTGRVTINENRTWRVGAVTDGRIVEIVAKEGDRVERGQVLARMHSHETHESRAEYRRAISELEGLKANLEYAQRVRERTIRLFDLKAASQQQVEHAEGELRTAETALRNGEVELERTRIHLEDFLGVPAEVPEERERSAPDHNEHDHIPIRAPAAGTLLRRNVTAGTVVEPSSDLFVISDLSMLWTKTAIAEEHLSRIRLGMPASVYVQAYSERAFRGQLTRLDTALDPTTRNIVGYVDVPNPTGMLKPEMYATVELELSGTTEAIFVPEVSIQEVNAKPVVFVRTAPDRFEPRVVSTAPGVSGYVRIVSGLRAGDEVATEGSFLLKSQLLKSTFAEE